MGSEQTVTVLLVDDDDVDVKAVRRAFRKAKIANPMLVARDGVEALAMLRGEDGHQDVNNSGQTLKSRRRLLICTEN